MQKIPFPEHIRGQSPNTSCSKQTHGRRTVRSGIDSFHRRTSGCRNCAGGFSFLRRTDRTGGQKRQMPYRWKTDRANCTVAKDTPKRPDRKNGRKVLHAMLIYQGPETVWRFGIFPAAAGSVPTFSNRNRQRPGPTTTAVRVSGARYRRASSHTRSDVVSRTCRTNSPR